MVENDLKASLYRFQDFSYDSRTFPLKSLKNLKGFPWKWGLFKRKGRRCTWWNSTVSLIYYKKTLKWQKIHFLRFPYFHGDFQTFSLIFEKFEKFSGFFRGKGGFSKEKGVLNFHEHHCIYYFNIITSLFFNLTINNIEVLLRFFKTYLLSGFLSFNLLW